MVEYFVFTVEIFVKPLRIDRNSSVLDFQLQEKNLIKDLLMVYSIDWN